jgi:hypothetical protein
VTDWHPDEELSVLLDALTEEILSMSDHDMAVGMRDQRESVKEAAQEMRRSVAAAECGLNSPPALGSIERSHSTQKHVN